MAAQDVILLLLPVQLHDDREHKQVMPAPTAPTSPHTLLSEQRSTMTAQDVILLLLPVQWHDGREHKQVMPTPTSPRTLLPDQLYYDRTRCYSYSVPSQLTIS